MIRVFNHYFHRRAIFHMLFDFALIIFAVGGVVVAQFERLQEIEHLEHCEALRRRRSLVERDAAIAAADWLAPLRSLRTKIGLGEKSSPFAREAG